MEFFNSAVDVLKTLVVALGAGLGVWGAVNLMEGYGGDNPSANAHVPSALSGFRLLHPTTLSVLFFEGWATAKARCALLPQPVLPTSL